MNPSLKYKKQKRSVIVVSLLLVLATLVAVVRAVWRLNQGTWMTLGAMESKARRLVGARATFCGTSSFVVRPETPAAKFNSCLVKSYCNKSPFWAVEDSGDMRSIFTYGQVRRTLILQTPEGKLMTLSAHISRKPHSDEWVKVTERQCKNPRVESLWVHGPQGLVWDKE